MKTRQHHPHYQQQQQQQQQPDLPGKSSSPTSLSRSYPLAKREFIQEKVIREANEALGWPFFSGGGSPSENSSCKAKQIRHLLHLIYILKKYYLPKGRGLGMLPFGLAGKLLRQFRLQWLQWHDTWLGGGRPGWSAGRRTGAAVKGGGTYEKRAFYFIFSIDAHNVPDMAKFSI